MGNLPAGIIMGATMELALVGAVSIGAYNPPDLIAGTVLGVSLAIQSGGGAETALVLGIPIATVMLAANTGICQPLMLVMIHKCDRDAEKGNIRAFNRDYLIAGYLQNLFGIVCIPLAFYFGSDAVTALLGKIPEFVQSGMDITAALLPALGFAMLAQQMMNRKVAPFFFLGFFLVSYLGISTTGVAIFAVLIVIIGVTFGIFGDKQQGAVPVVETADNGGDFDEF